MNLIITYQLKFSIKEMHRKNLSIMMRRMIKKMEKETNRRKMNMTKRKKKMKRRKKKKKLNKFKKNQR
jgi:hypothetical protein